MEPYVNPMWCPNCCAYEYHSGIKCPYLFQKGKTMTKKDYIKLADAIAEAKIDIRASDIQRSGAWMEGADMVELDIARALKADNSAFSYSRFHDYITDRLQKAFPLKGE